jgi:hypothetical protein
MSLVKGAHLLQCRRSSKSVDDDKILTISPVTEGDACQKLVFQISLNWYLRYQ